MKLMQFTKRFDFSIGARPLKAESTGFDTGLYSLEGYEPELAQQVEEHFFKPVDEKASHALGMLERFGHHAPWDSEGRSAWTRFLLSLLVRCPEDIEALRNWWRSEVFGNPGHLVEARYGRIRRSEDPERLSEYLESQPIKLKEQHLFQSLCTLIDNALIGTEVNQMEWRVLESPAAAPTFLTSDRPVIRTTNLYGAGAHIAIPISPRLLFIATPSPIVLNAVLRAHQIKLVKDVNRQIVEGAQRFVYGVDDSQSRFVKDHFGMKPQPRLIEEILRKATETLAESHPPKKG